MVQVNVMLRIPRRHLLLGGGALATTKMLTPASAGYVLGKAGAGGGGGYVAKAVEWSSHSALVSVLSAADSPKRTIVCFLNMSQTAMDNYPVFYGDNQSCVV